MGPFSLVRRYARRRSPADWVHERRPHCRAHRGRRPYGHAGDGGVRRGGLAPALAARPGRVPQRPDRDAVRLDAGAVRDHVAPDPGDQVRCGDGPRGAVRIPAAGRRLDLRRGLGRPAQPQVAHHRRGCRDRGDDAAARRVPDHERAERHRGRHALADLPDPGDPVGRRGHPDAGSGGHPAAARSRPAPAAGERHQRLHPVRDDAARARGRRCGLRARVDRRDLLHRRGHGRDRHPDDRVHLRAHHPQVDRHRLLRRHGRGGQVHVHPPLRALAAHPVRDRVRADGGSVLPHTAHAGARVRRRRLDARRCSRSCSASGWWSAGS